MKVHQNIIIGGVDYGDKQTRKHSRFCNEGKWNNFIKPLLPKDCTDMTFVEMGCNAGLFLKMAAEAGFRNIVGIESDKRAYEVALKYRDCSGLNYKVINGVVDREFDFKALPVADVTLMANFHYHLDLRDFVHILDNLKSKTRYCLLVSVSKGYRRRHWKTDSRIEYLRRYFRNWEEGSSVYSASTKGDPHPREGMYSVIFKSELKRIPIKNIKTPRGNSFVNGKAIKNFIDKAKRYSNFDVGKSMYYKKLFAEKKNKMSPEAILRFVQGIKELIRNIAKNGIKTPILVDSNYQILDGSHRLVTTMELGYKSIIVRMI